MTKRIERLRMLCIAAASALGTLALGTAPVLAEQFACPAVPPPPPIPLPHVQAAMAANEQVIVVALGSSSTQGWMASNQAHTYPAVLQRLLNAAFPKTNFAVINRGIGGQDATEELARIEQDAIGLHPQLVIWQVGANGAMAGVDPAIFKRLVSSGVRRLKQAGADVILMDNQRSARVIAAPHHLLIDAALAEVAVEEQVALFSRGALMDAWRKVGRPYEEFVSNDGLHLNDQGYACVASALEQAIVRGQELRAQQSATAH